MSRFSVIFLSSAVVLLLFVAALPPASTTTHAGGMVAAAVDTVEQRPVQIMAADSLTGLLEGDEPVRRLVGNVQLRQENTYLWAARVTQYSARDEVLLEGSVRITDEGDTLTADRIRYDTRNRIGHATGNVRLSDGDVVVVAPAGSYHYNERRAVFRDGVVLEDSVTVLESLAGEYFVEDKRAEFAGDVRLISERSLLEADSVTYFREAEISDARGNVFIERWGDESDEPSPADSLRRTLLWGDTAFNNNPEGYSRVDGRALLMQLQADSAGAQPDTMLARAVRMESTRRDSLEQLIAVGVVRIWQSDLSATADSLVHDRLRVADDDVEDETRLFRNPIAWFEASQMSGDSLRVKGRNGSADSLFVRGNAFVAEKDDVLEQIHQLQGRDLTGTFEEDSLRFMTVGPNAEMIRFYKNDEDELDGAIEMSSDYMDFWFQNGELSRVNMGTTEGLRYPREAIPDPLHLSRYVWVPEQRPTRQELLSDLRLLQRFDPEALPPDQRPIATTDPDDE